MNSDPLDRFGGSRFLISIFGIALGAAVAIFSPKGLPVELAGMIVGIIGTFHAAKTATTLQGMKGAADVEATLPEEHVELVKQTASSVGQIQQLLVNAMSKSSGNAP